MKEVIIDGKTHQYDDEKVVQDYFTGEFIVKNNAQSVETYVILDRDGGYQGPYSPGVFINPNSIPEHLANNKIKILVTRYGNVYVIRNVNKAGNGKLYKSTEINNNTTFYDDYTNPRMNIANKFKPFDNMVKAFKDLNNKLILDTDRKALIKRNYSYGVESLTYKMFEGLDYTFGVELETSSGRLSEEDVKGLNLKCEFDGSLRDTPDQRKEDVLGGEYITGVLKGDSGMFQLQKICNKLSEKCSINGKCGVHVHVGGMKFSKENIVYMYILGEMLQDEIYAMLPASRRQNSYCRKLKSVGLDTNMLVKVNTTLGYKILIDEYFAKVFKMVSHGKMPSKESNKKHNHPLGSKCGYNKDTQRYCWLNFVTAMFNTKGSPEAMTLEFRNHSATLNYSKVKNWVRICMAFVSFVENHKASIRRGYWLNKEKEEHPINLSTILKASYPKTSKILCNYVEDRKTLFFLDNGDIEEKEYKNDKLGIKLLSMKEDVACV